MTRPSEAGAPATIKPPPARQFHAAALASYTATAAIFIYHGEKLTQRIAGQGTDPFIFVWFLSWWPFAITHHLNLLFTNLVWQPGGTYLGWVTSIPLLAILLWPLTLISPVLTFNILIICGPILAAWMAYFLCLHITRRPLPALIGGFLFGFSSYEMAQDTAVLNMSFTACVPLLLLVILARLDGTISRAQTILFGGVTLICQFLVCIEIFGMIFVFGGIAWALGLVFLPAHRPGFRRLLADGLWTSPFVVLALSPLLASMALHAGSINLPAIWPYYFTADPLNFFIPSANNLLGGLLHFSAHFNGGIQEQDGYIGLPLLLIIVLFAVEKRASKTARYVLLIFLFLLIASLGPRLWIAGQVYRAGLPWTIFLHLPLLGSALPTRFALFVSLLAAIIAALWMAAAATPRQRITRTITGILACIFLLPQFHPWTTLPNSRFFQPGRVQAAFGQNARLLVLPFAINGPSPFWQSQSNFGFIQTGGYLGFPPAQMQNYRAVGELFGNIATLHLAADIKYFCLATRTQFIVAGPGTTAPVLAAIAQLNWPTRTIDDVTIYTVIHTEPREVPPHG